MEERASLLSRMKMRLSARGNKTAFQGVRYRVRLLLGLYLLHSTHLHPPSPTFLVFLLYFKTSEMDKVALFSHTLLRVFLFLSFSFPFVFTDLFWSTCSCGCCTCFEVKVLEANERILLSGITRFPLLVPLSVTSRLAFVLRTLEVSDGRVSLCVSV